MEDLDDDLVRARHFAEEIDGYVHDAQTAMFAASGVPQEYLADLVGPKGVVRPTLEAWIDGPLYSGPFLGRVSGHAADLHLQFHFLHCAAASHNLLVYDRLNGEGLDTRAPGTWPADVRLMAASLDQDLVGKSRIAWERVMNLAYVMQLGEIPKYGRSKRKHFFTKFVPAHTAWDWFLAFETPVAQLDAQLRTPEFHAGSFIRTDLLEAARTDIPFGVANLSAPPVWDAFRQIANGLQPTRFTGAHMPALGLRQEPLDD